MTTYICDIIFSIRATPCNLSTFIPKLWIFRTFDAVKTSDSNDIENISWIITGSRGNMQWMDVNKIFSKDYRWFMDCQEQILLWLWCIPRCYWHVEWIKSYEWKISQVPLKNNSWPYLPLFAEFFFVKYCNSIVKGFRTIVSIFIVISTTFRPKCPPAFFRCLSNTGTFKELRITSFIESTGVACSDSVSNNRVQVLIIPELLLACSQDWTCNLLMIVTQEANGRNAYNCYAMCSVGNNNKDKNNSPKRKCPRCNGYRRRE